jgi:hypothetical protein
MSEGNDAIFASLVVMGEADSEKGQFRTPNRSDRTECSFCNTNWLARWHNAATF